MFGASARDLIHVVITAVGLYVTTLALVRIAGRRTVSQLSAFDALITIGLGSVFATSVVSDPPSYGRGAVAVITLLALQLLVGTLRQRVPRMRRLLDFSTETVFDTGELHLDRSPLGPQLTADEIDSAVRAAGFRDRDCVAFVVLESNGALTVIPRERPTRRSP